MVYYLRVFLKVCKNQWCLSKPGLARVPGGPAQGRPLASLTPALTGRAAFSSNANGKAIFQARPTSLWLSYPRVLLVAFAAHEACDKAALSEALAGARAVVEELELPVELEDELGAAVGGLGDFDGGAPPVSAGGGDALDDAADADAWDPTKAFERTRRFVRRNLGRLTSGFDDSIKEFTSSLESFSSSPMACSVISHSTKERKVSRIISTRLALLSRSSFSFFLKSLITAGRIQSSN